MALPAGFLDELRARTPIGGLIGRRVKLARSGRNWKGCCPFHGEKSPSFHVYEDHFHCFGCGVHGDAISFVMQSQGASFPEAVAQLAAEAGMEVPKPTPQAAEAERRRLDLHGVLDAAAAFYQRRLALPEGARARDYLLGRGLTEDTIRRFGLGWSGDGRGGLVAELARAEVSPAMLLEAGLLRPTETDAPGGELFYSRVMFPIRDRRGRIISFGGRILGDGQPKYVNGPETPLYSKRRTLFASDFAREAARSGAPVVVVEGYMDVIALHQAGFRAAVAPLGTALTEDQLEELWRLSPAPILCFDGDKAGGRAAARAAELALPLLTPERTLRLATLPATDDPDTLVRRGGPAAFQAVLDSARPLSDVLFALLGEGVQDASPEQRAGFHQRLEAAAARIGDKALAREYRRALMDRFYASRPRAAPAGRGRLANGRAPPRPPPAFHRQTPGPEAAAAERARILLAILLRHPVVLPDVEEAFGALDLPPALDRLRTAILHWSVDAPVLDSASLMAHLTLSASHVSVMEVLAEDRFKLPACALPGAMPAEAEAGWWHIFGLMNRNRLEDEVAAARREFEIDATHAKQIRLTALRAALNALHEGDGGELSE